MNLVQKISGGREKILINIREMKINDIYAMHHCWKSLWLISKFWTCVFLAGCFSIA